MGNPTLVIIVLADALAPNSDRPSAGTAMIHKINHVAFKNILGIYAIM